MGTFVFTHPLIFMLIVALGGSSYEVKAAQSCHELNGTDCSSCIHKADHCYWCPNATSGDCLKWDWADYPSCKGNRYFYGQCNLNGVGIIIIFSVGVFLLLVAIASCCICCGCCYMRHRRRRVVRPVTIITDDMHERQRLFQARDEIRHKYGVDTNDSTV